MGDERITDEEIISLYFARDEEAIHESDRAYGKLLYRLSMSILADREDSEENKYDTYLTAWRSIPPARPVHLAAFLLKICRNHALDRLKRNRAGKRRAVLGELTDELADCIPGGDVEGVVDARELGRLLTVFLKNLPEEERFIMVSRCFRLQSFAEIAGVLSCSEGRIRTILYRTRLKLRQYLEDNGYQQESGAAKNGH